VEQGIVQISVRDFPEAYLDLENSLEKKYGIYRAVISETGTSLEQTKKLTGRAASLQLSEMLQDGDSLGLAWGSTIYEMVEAFPRIDSRQNISIVQLTGGLHQVSRGFNPVDLTSGLSDKITGSSLYQLFAPAIVDDSRTKDILLNESTIKETLNRFGTINIAVVGIGSMSPTPSTMLYRDGFIKDAELESIKALDIAGDINSHFYDSGGNPCRTIFDERTIGIDLQQLKSIRYVMALACGSAKVKAIHAALKGRIVNIIVTDRETAEALMEL
jgi:DNA-binding transcriptional regulator LsrR (DeoR family)